MKKTLRPLCILCAFLIAVAALPSMTACGRVAYTTTYLDVFDTVLTVTVGASDRAAATAVTTAIHSLVLDLHRQFDIYHTYEGLMNLKTVNDRAGDGTAIPVGDDIIQLLLMGKEIYDLSDGKVNILLGAVLTQWHDCRAAGDRIPDPAALTAALASHCDPDALVIDPTAGTVRITDPAASLDVGAIAKGYAAARIQQYAAEQGITSLLVNLGGHVLAIGRHPDGNPWTVAVRNPADGSTLCTLEVENASVVTSGDDQRTYTVDGVAYHHLIDPATGYPATLHRAVTVLVPLDHTAAADGLSTALFLLPQADGAALTVAYDGTQALWVEPDGTVISTQGWPNSTQE